MYDLKKYFKYLKSTRIKNELNLFREYPRYEEILKRYETEYTKSLSDPLVIPKTLKGQVYSIPYKLIGDDIFELNISIDNLYNLINDSNSEAIIKNNSLYRKEFDLKISNDEKNTDIMKLQLNPEVLKQILNERELDKEYAEKCINNNEDIICGDFYGLTQEQISLKILDGNHRCYSKLKAGHNVINGTLISRNVWINCLLTKPDELFVKIFSNMNIILGYRNGKCDIDYVKKNLYDI